MGQVGSFALIAAFVLTIYAIGASVVGFRTRRNDLIISGERGIITAFGMVFLA